MALLEETYIQNGGLDLRGPTHNRPGGRKLLTATTCR